MLPTTYTKKAQRTEPTASDYAAAHVRLGEPEMMRLLHAQIGLTTESGELADQVKRHVFYGASLDAVNLKEEAGDLLWYLAVLLDACGSSFEEVMQLNIDKLRARFPYGPSGDAAINRDTEAERNVLER